MTQQFESSKHESAVIEMMVWKFESVKFGCSICEMVFPFPPDSYTSR